MHTPQNAPGIARTGCAKSMRARWGSSGGALCLRALRSASSSRSIAPGAGTAICGGSVRRRSRLSMLFAVRSREAVKASKLDSVSSIGEAEVVRGTTVVVTCSFGARGERGETGGRQGVGWAIFTAGAASGAARVGKRRRPTALGSVGRAFGSGVMRIVGCSTRAGVRKNEGRRMEGREGASCAATWPFELRRAVI